MTDTPAPPAKAKILVADDIKEIRDLLRLCLEPKYDVVTARNGEEAWELFNSEKPDLVMSDVVMPRMKGDELCRKIKTESSRPNTPVILVTAATKDKELADGFWQKATASDGFVSKPFSPSEVIALVAKVLAEKRA